MGEADEWGPLAGDRLREGQMRPRDCGSQVGPWTEGEQVLGRATAPTGRARLVERAGRGSGRGVRWAGWAKRPRGKGIQAYLIFLFIFEFLILFLLFSSFEFKTNQTTNTNLNISNICINQKQSLGST